MRQDNPTLQQLLERESIKRRFDKLLDKSAPAFISSIISICNSSKKLQDCSPYSVVSAAGIAAALKLPINPSLGFAYIVPYNGQAQFQMGYRGFIQLAMRSGQYRTLNAGAVCEGQIKEIDFLTGEIVKGEKISDEVVGYVAYMELLNGFNKALYMTIAQLEAHAEKFSQSYAYDLKTGRKSSVWTTNFNAMARKTVLKRLLSQYGVMSIDQQSLELATALQADQSVITEDGFHYIDNEQGEEKIVPFSDAINLPVSGNDDDDEENNSSDENNS